MDSIRATPREYEILGLLADKLKGAEDWLNTAYSRHGVDVKPALSLLGIPAIQQTMERVAYGEPLTTGSGMTTNIRPEAVEAALTLLPVAGQTAKVAEKGLLAAGRAGERYAENVVPQILDRGGLPAQLLQDLAQGSRSSIIEKNPAPFIVKHGTNDPFDEFKSGMGVTAKHIYTTPEDYADDAAKYGKELITAEASPKSLIDFSSEGKLDKQTIGALKKAAKDAGITDKYYPFESFMDDLMSGQLYQKGGGSRDQDALLSELFSKYQAVKMPDATFGGGISKSVVFEDPSLLKILKNEDQKISQESGVEKIKSLLDVVPEQKLYRVEEPSYSNPNVGAVFYSPDKKYVDLYNSEGRLMREASMPEGVLDIRNKNDAKSVIKWVDKEYQNMLNEYDNGLPLGDEIKTISKILKNKNPSTDEIGQALANITIGKWKMGYPRVSGIAEKELMDALGKDAMTMIEAGTQDKNNFSVAFRSSDIAKKYWKK